MAPTAALPMYDADRASVAIWWAGIARALVAKGFDDVPAAPEWPADLDAHWRDPRLLLSQTCGFPLVTRLGAAVQVVGAFRYTAPGCSGIGYRSELVARRDAAGRREPSSDGGRDAGPKEALAGNPVAAFRGRRAVVNSLDSHSGSNALRGHVAPLAVDGRFFASVSVSGSHRRSLEAVRAGAADLAAIDCITLAGLVRQAPASMDGLRVVASTAAAPGLPLVTSAHTGAAELDALRSALRAACADPALAEARAALFIEGFSAARREAWDVVDATRRFADSRLLPPD